MEPFCGDFFQEAAVLDGFCVHGIPVLVREPRSIIAVGTSGFLALERATSQVVWVFDTNGDDVPDARVNIGASGGNHGLAYYNGFIYISSDTTVWRWSYNLGDQSVTGNREVVVVNMNADGQGGAPQGHSTRTLIFDKQGRLYISIGSAGNVDADSYRSRIRRFPLVNSSLPLDFQTGEVFADGLRNEVGLGFDRHGVLWGVENGADSLHRDDLGGDIHNDNPAEELNRFPEELAGSHWGYPECWTEYNLHGTGLGQGTSWAWPSFLGQVTDEQCRENRVQSELAMQAHSAPLGIVFYNYTEERPADCVGAFPKSMDGYAFIAFHGSWNRDVPTGYKVVYVPMSSDGRVNSTDSLDLLRYAGSSAKWGSGYRPVDVDFDDCGRLFVTSDGTQGRGSGVARIAYNDGSERACCGNVDRVFPPSGSSPANQLSTVALMLAIVIVVKFL